MMGKFETVLNSNWDAMTSKGEAYEVLKGFKKDELKKIATFYNIRVSSADTKDKIKQYIVDLKVGTRLRMETFVDMKDRKNNLKNL